MKKIIYVEKCEWCPHFVVDPDYKIEFWGKNVCTHDPGEMKEIKNEMEIPEWCPLQDAEC